MNHPDYKTLKTSNVNDAINMLKYLIYISNGCVYLKSKNENNYIDCLCYIIDFILVFFCFDKCKTFIL